MAQLLTSLALLSGLLIGGLGFLFTLLRDKDFAPICIYAFSFLAGLVAFFIASAAGVAAFITRLLDFRLTAQKVRRGGNDIEPLTVFCSDASAYGKAAWRFFWILCISFLVAVLLTAVSLTKVYLVSATCFL